MVAVSALTLSLGYVIVLAAYQLQNRAPFVSWSTEERRNRRCERGGPAEFSALFQPGGDSFADFCADGERVGGSGGADDYFADVGTSDAETAVELGVFAAAGVESMSCI